MNGLRLMVRCIIMLFFRDTDTSYRLLGDMVYAQVMGSPMLIVSSPEIVFDLLDKRSAIYSDRSVSVMNELYALGALLQLPLSPGSPEIRHDVRDDGIPPTPSGRGRARICRCVAGAGGVQRVRVEHAVPRPDQRTAPHCAGAG